jgi:hypothetical protein
MAFFCLLLVALGLDEPARLHAGRALAAPRGATVRLPLPPESTGGAETELAFATRPAWDRCPALILAEPSSRSLAPRPPRAHSSRSPPGLLILYREWPSCPNCFTWPAAASSGCC